MKEISLLNVMFVMHSFLEKEVSVHEGKKTFKCNDYDASFSRKLDLNRHIKTVHEEKKPVKCL